MLGPLPVKRERNRALTSVLEIGIHNGVKVMPRYFFHVREGSVLHRDTEGEELADAEAARREAINSSREMLGERLLHGGSLNSRTIEIADETGHIVDEVNSRDVLFRSGQFRTYADDVTQSAPTNTPSE
jgi:hypothetical protein